MLEEYKYAALVCVFLQSNSLCISQCRTKYTVVYYTTTALTISIYANKTLVLYVGTAANSYCILCAISAAYSNATDKFSATASERCGCRDSMGNK